MKKGSNQCKVHGYTEDVVKKGKGIFDCRLCANRRHKEWRQKEGNREKIAQWAKRYQVKNPEKVEESRHEVKLKKQLKNLIAKKDRVLKKITEPAVNCIKHGLTVDVQDSGKRTKFGMPKYRCRLCHNEATRRIRVRNNNERFIHKK